MIRRIFVEFSRTAKSANSSPCVDGPLPQACVCWPSFFSNYPNKKEEGQQLFSYLNCIKSSIFFNDPDEIVNALQRGRRATGLQDESPLWDEHAALAQDVGVHLAVAGRRDDLAFHVAQNVFQFESERKILHFKQLLISIYIISDRAAVWVSK